MKYTLHIPVEQFGYAEVELEPLELEKMSLKEIYSGVKNQFDTTPQAGLDTKTWQKALDEYLETNNFSNADETFHKMSPQQQGLISEIRKSIARLNYKFNK